MQTRYFFAECQWSTSACVIDRNWSFPDFAIFLIRSSSEILESVNCLKTAESETKFEVYLFEVKLPKNCALTLYYYRGRDYFKNPLSTQKSRAVFSSGKVFTSYNLSSRLFLCTNKIL